MKLFEPVELGNLQLHNRIVMAPMTRSRAIDNIPNELMAEYYRQRASAGLIITEGVAPSPNGLGYSRIPGIFNQDQIDGWKKVTDAVHQEGGKIFIQLMHTGRVSHPDNMPLHAEVVAPSAIQLSGVMYTDTVGPQSYPVPKSMTIEDIQHAESEYVQAALNAVEAGFDGVELHGANGYLIEQFINPAANQRTDAYGGSPENRSRFAIEVARKVANAIGAERTGIRLSPYGVFNDMVVFDDVIETYEFLATELGKIGLVYIHTVDHSSMGAPEVPDEVKAKIQAAFGGDIIASGGFDKARANNVIENGKATLVAFGKPFLANPDFVYRLKNDLPSNTIDIDTFYTPGEKGYTDYPVAN